MRLFYTGAEKEGNVQESAPISLGSYVSGSPLPNGAINALFGGISQYSKEKSIRQVRAVVLKNETGSIQTPTVWYDNVSSEPITNYRFAFVTLSQDECGWFMEKIGQGDALPINAIFIDPKTSANAVSLGAMAIDGYMGIWIERTYNPKAVSDSMTCENLLAKHNTTNVYQVSTIETVADVADSLDGKYFHIDTDSEQYTFWYTTGAGAVAPSVVGRQLVSISINTGDTADAVATATDLQINTILTPRGEVSSSVALNVITLTATVYGSFPIPVDVDAGVTVTATTAGTSDGLETVEEIEFSIQY